jgi:hypothetical protein
MIEKARFTSLDSQVDITYFPPLQDFKFLKYTCPILFDINFSLDSQFLINLLCFSFLILKFLQ